MYGLAKFAFATKAQKLYEAGKLSDGAAGRLFQRPAIENNLHNKINAKARRGQFDQLPKGQMDAKKYRGISQPDNLPQRAAIDTGRVMKHQGHENSKIVSELNRQTAGETKVRNNTDGIFNGNASVRWSNHSGDPLAWDIQLPKKDSASVPRSYGIIPSARGAKESRALTARHEIEGEATAQSRMLRSLKSGGYNPSVNNVNIFDLNNHMNPEVLAGDARMIKQLSPEAQALFKQKLRHNVTGVTTGGVNLDEGQVMNMLRHQPKSSEGKARALNTPYFKFPNYSRDDLRRSFKTIGNVNARGNASKDVLSQVTDNYLNTPFYQN